MKRAPRRESQKLGVARLGRLLVFVGLVAAFVLTVALRAWQSDDAYITWRTAQNFVEGRGLTYNPGERVQAFTSPLWLVVGAFCELAFGEVYFSILFVSIVMSAVALVLVLLQCERQRTIAVGVTFAAVGSALLIDFSTSGMETPLLALLVVAFSQSVLGGAWRRAMWLNSLLFLCRPDVGAFTLFPLLGLLREKRDWKRAARRAAGPLGLLVVWEVFSLFYFGSPFANSVLAKLNSHISKLDVWERGAVYLWDFANHEPAMTCLLLGVIVFAFRAGGRERWLAAGVCSNLVYVMWVGGDFMRGRFLWVPTWACLFLLARLAHKISWPVRAGIALAGVASALLPWAPLFNLEREGGSDLQARRGIVDERTFYASTTSLLSVFYLNDLIEQKHLPLPPYISGLECARKRGKKEAVEYRIQVGFCGYFGGEKLTVYDWAALVDPFLARVPYIPREDWRPGHLFRHDVDRYVRRRNGKLPEFEDAGVESAYDDVQLVTHGPLWSVERLGAIARLNAGVHSAALERFERAGDELPAALLRIDDL